MFPRLLTATVLLSFPAFPLTASDDVVEPSHVLVPDGIFHSMRKVDSETLILPDAAAVMRQQQRRTAVQETRERAVAQSEADRLAEVQAKAAAAEAPADPESAIVEESVETVTLVEEPSTAVAEPAPVEEPTPTPEPEPSANPEPTPEAEATEP